MELGPWGARSLGACKGAVESWTAEGPAPGTLEAIVGKQFL